MPLPAARKNAPPADQPTRSPDAFIPSTCPLESPAAGVRSEIAYADVVGSSVHRAGWMKRNGIRASPAIAPPPLIANAALPSPFANVPRSIGPGAPRGQRTARPTLPIGKPVETPTTSPLALIAFAPDAPVPAAPRSERGPFCQRNAWSPEAPTT